MPNRRASRNAYYFFVQEKIPELRRRGLPVARVADAIPYCSADWALLREEEKEKYSEMAREWRAAQGKEPGPSETQKLVSTPLRKPGKFIPKPCFSPPDMSSLSLKSDQGEIPRGFRFHCQAASDSTHKIPISNFEFGHDQATVLQNFYKFIHPNLGNWPSIYCKSQSQLVFEAYGKGIRCKWHEEHDILFCALAVCKKIAFYTCEAK
ncbi:maelstrom-like protein [Heterocephalus glaber]|uniref:Protein maelstrom homolog n=1 Tax=Heterocephalus glaber TaxID=10181 RepID=G5AQ42_HETGA|nr:maelstrom-like protein [Heterocephalus glaber]